MRIGPICARGLVSALVLHVATSAGESPAGDLTVSYWWNNGTVQPSLRAEHQITVHSSGESEVESNTGTGDNAHHVIKSFSPDPAKLRVLMEFIQNNKLDAPPAEGTNRSPPPGSGLCRVFVTTGGNSYRVPCPGGLGGQVGKMVRDLIPPDAL
jgi:hypothetical protein